MQYKKVEGKEYDDFAFSSIMRSEKMENKVSILEKISKFNNSEQMVLLLSRTDFNGEMNDYINGLISGGNIDWDKFLGLAINHRVNGVIYKKIRGVQGMSRTVRRALNFIYISQKERNRCHRDEIQKLSLALEEKGINYAFLKGAVLNTIYYGDGERISNDTDILVDVRDLTKVIQLCTSLGYIQGEVENGKIIRATKKEILFAQLNTYETVPLIKKTGNAYLPFHEFDINFRLGNDDKSGFSNDLLQNTVLSGDDKFFLRTMTVENFLIYLCIHLYREAVMVYKIAQGADLILYKFMDIHHYIEANRQNISWKKLGEKVIRLDKVKDIFYVLFFTEKLYPGTVDDNILEMFEPEDVRYLDQYRGRDNSDEIYDWKLDFYERMFYPQARMAEAKKNIGRESERYNNIREELQKVED